MYDPSSLMRRRALIQAATGAAALGGLSLAPLVRAQSNAPIRIGLMLPYSGTFAQIGRAIEGGFRLALMQAQDRIGGRPFEIIKLDDESEPSKAVDNANKLVRRDKVDVIVGTVHSGVQMGIHKVARESGVLNLIPNAGVLAATRSLCAPNVFRTSFSNSQPTLALGKPMMERGLKKAVWISWKYAAGTEALEGFKESYTKAGGTILKELELPFPNVEFQAYLTEIASLKPDATVSMFAGAAAGKFLMDYAAAGLKEKIPLWGSGFLTEGVLQAAGRSADGVMTTMHYSDVLDTPRNKEFRAAYLKAIKAEADVYSVQGYDAALLLLQGAQAVQGDLNQKLQLYKAMESAVIDSPRGRWTMSPSHNPVQDMYLRVVENGDNKVLGIAAKALADPGTGCKMA